MRQLAIWHMGLQVVEGGEEVIELRVFGVIENLLARWLRIREVVALKLWETNPIYDAQVVCARVSNTSRVVGGSWHVRTAKGPVLGAIM